MSAAYKLAANEMESMGWYLHGRVQFTPLRVPFTKFSFQLLISIVTTTRRRNERRPARVARPEFSLTESSSISIKQADKPTSPQHPFWYAIRFVSSSHVIVVATGFFATALQLAVCWK